jgi:hypothetical protein
MPSGPDEALITFLVHNGLTVFVELCRPVHCSLSSTLMLLSHCCQMPNLHFDICFPHVISHEQMVFNNRDAIDAVTS